MWRQIFAVAAVLGILITGCGTSDSQSGEQSDSQSSGNAEEDSKESSGGNGSQAPEDNGLLAAGETAQSKLPDSTIIEIESEDDGSYWEVEVAFPGGFRKELEISADGKDIERGPRGFQQDGRSKKKWRKRLKEVELDYQEAYEKVIETRDGQVTELELDEEDGKLIWEADVISDDTEYEVSISARNGKVVENEED